MARRPDPHIVTDGLADAVKRGLLGDRPKTLPCQFIYDAYGSQIFEEICQLPEYYPTRCEISIIEERRDEISVLCPTQVSIVEVGAGSATKTRPILSSLRRERSNLSYIPIDISASALQSTVSALRLEYPDVLVEPITGEYHTGLRHLARTKHENVLFLWLGTSVGNVERHEAESTLRLMRDACLGDGLVVLGIDLKKDKATLERAYNDARGVTARFNLNLLGRINRELGGHFELERFEHRAFYNEEQSRIEMHIVSRDAHTVPIDYLRATVHFEEGESIHTENSYKFSKNEIGQLGARSGFRHERFWTDSQALYSLNVFRATV